MKQTRETPIANIDYTVDLLSLKLEPLAVAVSPYGWLMTHCGWLAG